MARFAAKGNPLMSSPLADTRPNRAGLCRPWIRNLAIPIALLVGASACGSGSDASNDGTGSTNEGSVDVDVSSDIETTEAAIEYESPLGDFLGWNRDFNSEDEQEKWKEEERKVEEAVAVCMRAEGFEYTPVDHSQYESFAMEEEGLEWGTKAFVEKYGFGASTQMFSQATVGPDLVGHSYDEGAMEETEDSFVDPNQDYVETLSDGDREAYYSALHGNNDYEWDETLSDEENDEAVEAFYNEDYIPEGCYNEAWENGGFGGGDDYEAFDNEFGDVLNELYERMESDPRVIDAKAKVETCMTEAGYSGDPDELQEAFWERTQEITNNMPDPFEGVDFEAMSDEERDELFAEQQQQQLSDENKVLLGEIQADEIATALAMWDCNGGSLYGGDSDELTAIRIELEQEFLDKHKDALAPYEGTFG